MMWRSTYSRRKRFNPVLNSWWDVNRLQREMGFRLGGTVGPINRAYPKLNAWTGDEGVIVRAELPGIDSENIEITVKGKTLTISGNQEKETESNEVNFYRRERRIGDFSRSLELPFYVNEELVEANLSQGILEIKIPRMLEEQPKKISVQSE
jgi:HSP20 family protein